MAKRYVPKKYEITFKERILRDKEERKLIIGELESLKALEGWNILCSYMQDNVDDLTEDMLNIESKLTGEDLEICKIKRHLQLMMLSLPDLLIKYIEQQDVSTVIKSDENDSYD